MTSRDINIEELKSLRHELHAHPEVSGQEEQTAQRISAYLKKYNPDHMLTGLGGHGVAAVFNGKSPGKRILVRAELDALPIAETNEDIPYKSAYPENGHKCGHDGHMVMVAGLAQIYAQSRPERGEVVLLFQPSEEDGRGARAVCDDPQFSNIKPDYAFALHNLPGEKMGTILCKDGAFSSSVETIIINIDGKTSHAAEPGKAIPASAIIPDILSYTNTLNNSDRFSEEFQRAALVRMISGEENAYGTTAGDAILSYTIRARTPNKLQRLRDNIVENVTAATNAYNTARDLSKEAGLRVSFSSAEPFMANMNNADAVSLVKSAAEAAGLSYIELESPNDWGEDFGYFTNLEDVKGVMFGLGAGENTPNLHNPHYDFPDELIPKGITMFSEMIGRVDHDF